MAALYFIHEVVEHSYEYADILDKVDLIFIPTANPGLIGFKLDEVKIVYKVSFKMVTNTRLKLIEIGIKIVAL